MDNYLRLCREAELNKGVRVMNKVMESSFKLLLDILAVLGIIASLFYGLFFFGL